MDGLPSGSSGRVVADFAPFERVDVGVPHHPQSQGGETGYPMMVVPFRASHEQNYGARAVLGRVCFFGFIRRAFRFVSG